jgi:hypothetical protein
MLPKERRFLILTRSRIGRSLGGIDHFPIGDYNVERLGVWPFAET